MVALPTSFINEVRGRQSSSAKDPLEGGSDDGAWTSVDGATESSSPDQVDQMRKLAGHPCAAGCGHICWVASGSGSLDELEVNSR